MSAQLVRFVMSGITVGAIYALVALGFALIYNASHVVNFAQGEFLMIGGMTAVSLVNLLVKSIAATGTTMILVEHNMRMVMEISDRVLVLDYGRLVAEGTPAFVRSHPRVVEAYLGRKAG